MDPTLPPPDRRGRLARFVAVALRETAVVAGILVLTWALFAYVLPRFGINT